jgi:DNA-directed RNA polymerase I subunit RPA2
MSILWPQVDMPFTESGMSPDVIINPHAFPSRMTIGMLVESMAGKAGAIHGIYQDATPFRFDEKNMAVKYFGEQMLKAGYSYYGTEPMYSGVLGTEFKADIYFGVVYYQRLRHMVKDKFQVRSIGPVNQITKQPLKGRKLGGGIRFGEMERDSLIAHGASFLLQDRFMGCSDSSKVIFNFFVVVVVVVFADVEILVNVGICLQIVWRNFVAGGKETEIVDCPR